METVFVAVSLLSLHRAPEETAEVVTQARLGETARALEAVAPEAGGTGGASDWVRLELGYDGYTGWAKVEGLAPGNWPEPGTPVVAVRQLFAHLYAAPRVQAPLLLSVPLGTPLPQLEPAGEEWRRVGLPGGREAFVQAGDVTAAGEAWAWETAPGLRRSLVKTGRQLLGVPYRWGGTTPWGIDCSGLVQLVYRLHGLALPRDAGDQAKAEGTFRVEREDLLPGDLLFFAEYSHVGLAISHFEFLHATTHLAPVVQVSEVDDPHWAVLRDEVRRLRLPSR